MSALIRLPDQFAYDLFEASLLLLGEEKESVHIFDNKGVNYLVTCLFVKLTGRYEVLVAELTGNPNKPRTTKTANMFVVWLEPGDEEGETGWRYAPFLDDDTKLTPAATSILRDLEDTLGVKRTPDVELPQAA